MRENLLRTLWQQDGYAVNGWLSLPATFSAEVMAHQGWDSLTIDLQHGLIDYQNAVGMLQAISTTRTVPFVRVPWLDPAIIMKVLDAGAYGVICPMINSAAEAREFVAACRYPPAGIRSCGPIRANIYAGSDYVANANRTIITMAMIETRSGLDNLDEILSVEGLDAIYVGPADLALALGCEPQLDPTEEDVRQSHRVHRGSGAEEKNCGWNSHGFHRQCAKDDSARFPIRHGEHRCPSADREGLRSLTDDGARSFGRQSSFNSERTILTDRSNHA